MADPRRIVPVVTSEEHASVASVRHKAHVAYHGGPLLTAAEVFTVFWGAAWGQAPQNDLVVRLNAFFDYILTSSLIDLLAEYSVPGKAIGHGRRAGTTSIAASEPGGGNNQIDDSAIQQALQAWIQAGTIPQPSPNRLHFIYLPPGVTAVTGAQQSCQTFCGYHSNIGSSLFYAVEPYLTCAGCTFGSGGALDSLTKVSSHELCEAITDPAGDGWYDDTTGNEIGDICNTSVAQLGAYTVQMEWSNSARGCQLAPHPPHKGRH
jgi:hypothetical protein